MEKATFRKFCRKRGLRGKSKERLRKTLKDREKQRVKASAIRALVTDELFPGVKRGR